MALNQFTNVDLFQNPYDSISESFPRNHHTNFEINVITVRFISCEFHGNKDKRALTMFTSILFTVIFVRL